MKKNLLALTAAAMILTSMFTGCGSAQNGASTTAGEVYYLNFKPEAHEQWQALAAVYTQETGVPVTIVTAASHSSEETLMSEMAKSNPPTLFHVNGPVGLANWKDYCLDLSGTDIYSQLTSENYVLKDGDTPLAIAMAVESYGIITNKTLLAKAGYTPEDISSFEDLKRIAEDITARKDELGFAAFTSAGMDRSSSWRYQTHLANLPIYYEYQERGADGIEAIRGDYLDNYKVIFDLYINNATCDPAALSGKTGDDARNEFLDGQAVFFQNGSWEYSNLVGKDLFSADELVMIPIYIGVSGEENQGLCTGTENFWCVNNSASEENIQATLDFINWCVTSEKGVNAMANEMGFVIPYQNAVKSPNLFVKQDAAYTAEGKLPVRWDFTSIPSQTWKDDLATALTAYAAGTGDWDDVVASFVDGWASEYAALND